MGVNKALKLDCGSAPSVLHRESQPYHEVSNCRFLLRETHGRRGPSMSLEYLRCASGCPLSGVCPARSMFGMFKRLYRDIVDCDASRDASSVFRHPLATMPTS